MPVSRSGDGLRDGKRLRSGADDVTQTPVRGAFTESFNDCLRDECLNDHLIASLAAARRIIEACRTDYKAVRPHSSLGRHNTRHGHEKTDANLPATQKRWTGQ
jgi:transposase InsO family protein